MKVIRDGIWLCPDAAMIANGSEDDLGGQCGGSGGYLATDFLAYAAWGVRVLGWTSRTAAREDYTSEKRATADVAFEVMTDKATRVKLDAHPTEEDIATAIAAAEWAESLSDAEVDGAKGDYLHNLRAAARTGLVTHKTAGIIGSTIVAYQREIGRARLAAERATMPKADIHMGTIKQRLSVRVKLDFVTGYETQYGYTTVLKFRAENGALLVWKASNTDLARGDVGKSYDLTGTVTKHEDYRGERQTLVNRCKLSVVQSTQAA